MSEGHLASTEESEGRTLASGGKMRFQSNPFGSSILIASREVIPSVKTSEILDCTVKLEQGRYEILCPSRQRVVQHALSLPRVVEPSLSPWETVG